MPLWPPVGGMIGQERTVLPLLADRAFGLTAFTAERGRAKAERFARGDIDEDEYTQRRDALRSRR